MASFSPSDPGAAAGAGGRLTRKAAATVRSPLAARRAAKPYMVQPLVELYGGCMVVLKVP